MVNIVITIKVNEEIAKLIEKMIELGIARSKNEAVNLLIEYGRAEIEKKIREQEEVIRLADEWLKSGFPYKRLNTSDLREERYE
ncbi:VapB-type antitoxin [Sulfolobus sp. S-194]|uniref:VapB-type antitoxin n=1 Tax=Sulfolobus sp. S-194 TaxID=2512240 RepID=UPI001436E4EB|nr:VapB-type antitoxin [Sulfolobus sp. S-194]QIW22859.1 VapB-type antitoxin [Sulfolobus sp. S-194]